MMFKISLDLLLQSILKKKEIWPCKEWNLYSAKDQIYHVFAMNVLEPCENTEK